MRPLLLLMLLVPLYAFGQTVRSVQVNSLGQITYPTNLFAANSNQLYSVVVGPDASKLDVTNGIAVNLTLNGVTVAQDVTMDRARLTYDGIFNDDGDAAPIGFVKKMAPLVLNDITALLATTSTPMGRRAYLLTNSVTGNYTAEWIWCPTMTDADNGNNIRRPADIASDATAGRWQAVGVDTAIVSTVNNMAELLEITPTSGNATVLVRGYYAPGDGGGGTYVLTNTIAGTNAYGGRILALGGAKSWELLGDSASAKQFGAKGDGTTDDTAAINALFASGYKSLLIPDGEYKITSQLRFARSNVHLDWRGTVKAAAGVNYHLLFLATGAVQYTNNWPIPTLENVSIDGHGVGTLDGNALNAAEYFPGGQTGAAFGGNGLNIGGVTNLVLRGMRVKNCPTFAVAIIGCLGGVVDGLEIDNGNGNNSAFYNGKNSDGLHFFDSSFFTYSNIRSRSSDDNFAVTAQYANVESVIGQNLIGVHSITGNGSTYRCLATNYRVTRELGTDKYVRNVSIDGFDFSGGNGGYVFHNVTTDPASSNVKVSNGTWRDLTEVGTASSPAKFFGTMSGCWGVGFHNVTFTNIARWSWIQNSSNINYSECKFYDIRTNNWDGTRGVITLDLANSTSVGRVGVYDCDFDLIAQQALRFIGLVGTNKKVNEPIEIIDSRFSRGGLVDTVTSGYSAIRVTGIASDVVLRGNRIRDWSGIGIDIADCDQVVASDNLVDGTGAAISSLTGIYIDATAGGWNEAVSLIDNFVFGCPSSGITARNAKVLKLSGNTLVGNQRLSASQPAMAIRINGDGTGPDTAGWSGSVTDNLVVGVGSGNGIDVAVANAPAYSGSPLLLTGNKATSFTTPIQRDLVYSIDYQFSDPIIIGQPADAGANGKSVFTLITGSGSSNTNVLFVQKLYNGSVASSATHTALAVIVRNQGSGGHTGSILPLTSTASHDQTNSANVLRGSLSTGRWTSSGNVTLTEGAVGQVVGTGAGVGSVVHALSAQSPSLSGGATVSAARGLYIAPQSVSGVTNGYGVYQLGTNDLNVFQGKISLGDFGGPTISVGSGVPSSSEPNGSTYHRTDGTGPNLYVRENGAWVAK